MKKNFKRIITSYIIITIIAIVYNILYFVIQFNRELNQTPFWILYGFTMFVFISLLFTTYLGIGDKDIKSRVLGIPIIYLSVGYLISQLVLDAFFMAIGSYVELKSWIIILIETLIISFYAIAFILRKTYKDAIMSFNEKDKKEYFIRNLRLELESIRNLITNKALLIQFDKLYETAKYTDPVSNELVYKIEDKINLNVSNIKKNIEYGDFNEMKKLIIDTTYLLKERKAVLSVHMG